MAASEKVYIVLGLPKSGRSEVAKAISWALKLCRANVLTVGYLHLAGELACKTGGELAHCIRTVLSADREQVVPRLQEACDVLNGIDPCFSVRALAELGVRVFDGIVTKEALSTTKAYLLESDYEVEIWWVRRPGLAPADIHPAWATEDDADGVIDNDAASVADLQKAIIDFLTPTPEVPAT